jgi:hypothetical protein
MYLWWQSGAENKEALKASTRWEFWQESFDFLEGD